MTEQVTLSALDELEAESIYIIREVATAGERPVLMYSVGKDSSVLLHLARKAFHPTPVPFPLLHVDTGFKFPEMIAFRDRVACEYDLDLRVHLNRDAIARGTNPWSDGTVSCCSALKTEALLEALRRGAFDLVMGGARREEERSRAKERVFSVRNEHGQWDPRQQRPEFWQLYNTRLRPGESMRVFPLSDWTELDVWRYIAREGIEVVPLYFAEEREVVRRGGQLIPLTASVQLLPGEDAERLVCRFRTLGCSPCTGAVASTARTPWDVVAELQELRLSERTTRLIDHDQDGSMERKKRAGYF